MDIVKYKTNTDYLVNSGIVEIRPEGDQESVFTVEQTEKSSEESGEKTISEKNIQTEIQMAQKEDWNTEIRLGNVGILYKSLTSNLKWEINFLKNQLLAKDTYFQDKITFFRRHLSEALAKKVGTSAYLSTSTIAVNADETPVNGNLVNSKPEESAIRSDSKKKNTKEKSNTETNVNSNASNNIETQRRETEKKNESASRTIWAEPNGKKDQNKSQKIVILGGSMIKNIKGWEISKKLQNANVYVRHFSRAKVRCMKDYSNPSLRENPDHFVLHVSTNDLDSDRSPDLITKWIVDDASSLKTDKHGVNISNIITWKWSFHGKSKWGKQMFEWTLFPKKCFIDWPFQDFETAGFEWE